MGYKPSLMPALIRRNILENPVWYSSYTPYQAELAQGRLEALLNFQTMVGDLTGMEIANASLLDEGTALAEALAMAKNACEKNSSVFFADSRIFPQNLDVLKTRAEAWGWRMLTGRFEDFKRQKDCFALILQYPDSEGSVQDIEGFLRAGSSEGCLGIVATDLLSLTLLKPPGEMGADIAVGSSQNFGIPLFFGGPHAAFLATRQKFIRLIPGRIVGVSKDRHGRQAYRLTLQTREQHIRREKATSNICTSQALLAVMAGFYAIYHGPQGLKKIALKINNLTVKLYKLLNCFKDIKIINKTFFDTLSFELSGKDLATKLYHAFQKEGINIGFSGAWRQSAKEGVGPGPRGNESKGVKPVAGEGNAGWAGHAIQAGVFGEKTLELLSESLLKRSAKEGRIEDKFGGIDKDRGGRFFITLDESVTEADILQIQTILEKTLPLSNVPKKPSPAWPENCMRQSSYLTHPVFNSYHSETELSRYIHRLATKELSLAPLHDSSWLLHHEAELC